MGNYDWNSTTFSQTSPLTTLTTLTKTTTTTNNNSNNEITTLTISYRTWVSWDNNEEKDRQRLYQIWRTWKQCTKRRDKKLEQGLRSAQRLLCLSHITYYHTYTLAPSISLARSSINPLIVKLLPLQFYTLLHRTNGAFYRSHKDNLKTARKNLKYKLETLKSNYDLRRKVSTATHKASYKIGRAHTYTHTHTHIFKRK